MKYKNDHNNHAKSSQKMNERLTASTLLYLAQEERCQKARQREAEMELSEKKEQKRKAKELLQKKDAIPYDLKVAERICARISSGELLVDICTDDHMPTARRVIEWTNRRPEFLQAYRMARNDRLDIFEEQIVAIADNARDDWRVVERRDTQSLVPNGDAIARSKLQIDVRLRHLRAGRPTVWGETSTLITKSAASDIELLSDEELQQKIDELDAKFAIVEGGGSARLLPKSRDLFAA
jgi:hypothetical protein